MGQATSLETRIRIMELAGQGSNDRQIAEIVNASEHTVRKWRRRGQRMGRAGLASTLGRPKQGALGQVARVVQETITAWRQAHPGWGAQTLRCELELMPELPRPLPSSRTIARYLRQEGMTRPYQRHTRLSVPMLTVVTAPHQRWQMDAQGHEQVGNVGIIAPINLNDCFSHARLLSYPCQVGTDHWQRQPTMEDYQLALRLAFTHWGLPQQLQVDHATPFFDNHCSSPYPTRLHQWLLALGIEVLFSQRATDQGLTERSHQLWHQQCLEQTAPFTNWLHLYTTLLSRRDHLNYHLPCRSTDRLPPLVACPKARHSGRFYHPQHETDLLDLQRLETFLAQNRWFRHLSRDGAFSLGAEVYYVGKSYAHQQIEITFDLPTKRLCSYTADGSLLKALPIRNFSRETLMGQFARVFNLPLFQFELPFDWHALHPVRLFDTLSV